VACFVNLGKKERKERRAVKRKDVQKHKIKERDTVKEHE